jgi:hypothetical protein
VLRLPYDGETNGGFRLLGDIRPQEFRHRIETPALRCEHSTVILDSLGYADKAGYVFFGHSGTASFSSIKYQSKCGRRLPLCRHARVQ